MNGAGLGGVTPLAGTSAAAMVWRSRGQLQVTVIAKATFAFVPDGPMARAEPEPIVSADVNHHDNPARSIRLSSDIAPPLARAEVLFTGMAHAPPDGPKSTLPVRLAVFDGQRPMLDKRLLCRDAVAFARMPVVYERAIGGIGVPENPVGVGSDAAGIVDPSQPQRPAGLGPIARAWPARRRLLGATPRQVLERPIVELPDAFDMAYFQAAPADQQIEALRGDEWIVLEGLHPTVPLLRTRLPSARGHAWVHGLRDSAAGQRREMRADTLRIDGDAQRCTVVWRLSFPVPDEAALPAVRVVVTTTAGSEDPGDGRLPSGPGTDEKTEVVQVASSAASTLALPSQPAASASSTLALPSTSPSATLALKPDAGAAAKPALPFTDPKHAPPMRTEPAAPKPPDPAKGSTLFVAGSSKAGGPALPFQPTGAARPAAAPKAPITESIELELEEEEGNEERSRPAGRMPGLPAAPAMLAPIAGSAAEATPAPPPMLGPLAGTGAAPAPAAPAPAEAAAPAPPPAPAAEPLVEIPIEKLATVAAELAERRDPRDKVLGRHGIGEADFAGNDRRWNEQIQREASRGQTKLRRAYDAAYLAAVEGFRGSITVKDYAQVVVGLERGTADEALDALSIQRPALMPLVREWTRKVAADGRLSKEARVLLASLRAPAGG